jgi:hypothetical protein
VEAVRCTTAATIPVDIIRFDLPVLDLELGADVTEVIAENGDSRWCGRAKPDERFERGQKATMTFSLSDAYWFDAATGRTLAAPTG